jgi:parallel beta-helix repeat protein
MRALRTVLVLLALPLLTHAAEFRVGPGQTYAGIGEVPWETLGPGDTVLIHARSTPYTEKWVIGRNGTQAAPITVRGVPDAQGNLPIIHGEGATTRSQLNYPGEQRGIIKIGSSNVPPDTLPSYIVIEGLHLRRARGGFTGRAGASTYTANASGIYLEKGEHITIRNCIFEDSGNGLFIAPNSADVLIEGNYLFGNGNPNSVFEHNAYTEALGIVYQYNRFGPLCANCLGNNLKDRSAGTVIRYNWIEGGNRQLDLVESDNVSYRADPSYLRTFVYGNVLLEPAGAGNRQIVHFGGDNGNEPDYRGTLYFWNNTIVSSRTDRTTLMRLSSNTQTAHVTGNVVFLSAAAGNTLSLTDAAGTLRHGGNWYEPGYVSSFGTVTGSVTDTGGNVTGTDPGFVDAAGQDFHILASSPLRGAAVAPPAETNGHPLLRQYVKHRSSESRPQGSTVDIGAYGFGTGGGGGTDGGTEPPDAGTGGPDAGTGQPDAGTGPGTPDAGTDGPGGGDGVDEGGCGCGATGSAPLALLLVALWRFAARRKAGWHPLALGWLLLICTSVPAQAQPTPGAGAPKKQGVSIMEIEARVFDRQKNAMVPLQESSDPYGMNVDAIFVVKVQGTWDAEAPLVLKLVASAPKEFSEAAGESPPWKVTQSRQLFALSENGVTYVPFLLPYHCSSQVTVTATLTGPGVKGSKTFKTSFICAE